MNRKAMRIRSRPEATDLVQRFVAGDGAAIDQIVRRYYGRMLVMAERLIRDAHLYEPACDSDDAVNAALFKLYRAARAGRIGLIETGDDFWTLFRLILKRTLLHDRDRSARLKRGGPGMPRTSSDGRHRATAVAGAAAHGFRRCGGLDDLCSHRPPPDESTIAADEVERLLDHLNDPLLRTVATMRAEEHTNAEIAQRLGLTTRSIRRKLASIREIWSAFQGGARVETAR
jgi:RNA polymerase sigma factor (sigma-70 family)